jgi:hypothetical protein
MPLTYELLLDLYRGRSTAVEQITDQLQLSALEIETPVRALLRALDVAPAPRHVVLTGSAGDGKTFAAVTAGTTSFKVITDASARREGVDLHPVDDLASQVDDALRGGRLLLAINRGQLERLYERVGARGGPLAAFVTTARARTVLQDIWDAPPADVAVVDLGNLERVSAARAIISKVAQMPDPAHLSPAPREAFRLARTALQAPRVVDWIVSVVRAATGAGVNVTMRQLWSFVSFVATGARPADDPRPLSLEDAVGSRLFSAAAEGPIAEVGRDRCDPTLAPNARLTRDILTGDIATKLRASALAPLAAAGTVEGRTLSRVAIVHDIGVDQPPRDHKDDFAEITSLLAQQPAGPQPLGGYPRALLRGMYRALNLWYTAGALPAWQTLCFDSSRFPDTAAVANSFLNSGAFKLALPRPPPEVAAFLMPHWRAPFIWLTAADQPRLRLTPRTVRALLTATAEGARQLEPGDLFALESWLRRVGRAAAAAVELDGDPPKIRVSSRSSAACVVLEEGLRGRTTISVEGAAIGGQP